MRHIAPIMVFGALLILALHSVEAQAPADPGQPGPYTTAYTTITVTNPNTGSTLAMDIYYPSAGGAVDPSGAPYATLVFAPGFLANSSIYSGNGEHLASWGYITAIPNFPDQDLEVRAADVQYLLSYLTVQNANGGSPYFHKIDINRFSLVGHSLGGINTMMVAARDTQINKAGVALDPASGPAGLSSSWNYAAEASSITAPLAVIGAATGGFCNSDGQYNQMYPYIGATHKAKFVIANGRHCDFMDTSDSLSRSMCYLLCGGQFSQGRLDLVERYTAAWLNYYVHYKTEYYTYLYGDKADEDVRAGRIIRDVQTSPRNVVAIGQVGAIELNWTLYDHPIIAGYNIYRSLESGNYSSTPYAQVGRESSYVDTDVAEGQRYFYVLQSRDPAGNKHQLSREVSVVPFEVKCRIHLPLILKGSTTN